MKMKPISKENLDQRTVDLGRSMATTYDKFSIFREKVKPSLEEKLRYYGLRDLEDARNVAKKLEEKGLGDYAKKLAKNLDFKWEEKEGLVFTPEDIKIELPDNNFVHLLGYSEEGHLYTSWGKFVLGYKECGFGLVSQKHCRHHSLLGENQLKGFKIIEGGYLRVSKPLKMVPIGGGSRSYDTFAGQKSVLMLMQAFPNYFITGDRWGEIK